MLNRIEILDLKVKAEIGDVLAQVALADYHFRQKVDYYKAAKWYRKAAEQGNANAQFGLANCYESGLGVPQDSLEALKWARRAAAQGHKGAISYLQLTGWGLTD